MTSNDQYLCNYNVCGDKALVRQTSIIWFAPSKIKLRPQELSQVHNTVFWSTQAAQSFKLGQPSVSSNDQYFCNYNVCGDETVVRQMSWRRNRLCLPKAIWSRATNSGLSRRNLWGRENFFVVWLIGHLQKRISEHPSWNMASWRDCSTTNELKEKSIVSAQSNLEPSDELWSRAARIYGDMETKYVICLIWGSSYLAILHTYLEALAVVSNVPKTKGEINFVPADFCQT